MGWGKALKTAAPVAKVIELSLSDSVDESGNVLFDSLIFSVKPLGSHFPIIYYARLGFVVLFGIERFDHFSGL